MLVAAEVLKLDMLFSSKDIFSERVATLLSATCSLAVVADRSCLVRSSWSARSAVGRIFRWDLSTSA